MIIQRSMLILSMTAILSISAISNTIASGGHSGSGFGNSSFNQSHTKDNKKDDLKRSSVQAWVVLTNNVENAEAILSQGNLEPLHDMTAGMKGAISIMKSNTSSNKENLQVSLERLSEYIHLFHVASDNDNIADSTKELKKNKKHVKNSTSTISSWISSY